MRKVAKLCRYREQGPTGSSSSIQLKCRNKCTLAPFLTCIRQLWALELG